MAEPVVTAVEREDDVIIVHVQTERLDEENVQRLEAEVSAIAQESPLTPIVLDLTRVAFMPSLSLAALVRLVAPLRDRQQRLLLAGMQPQVREVFVVTHLDRLFELHSDVATALRTVRPG
jgi:anti-sigma B factor antagonist